MMAPPLTWLYAPGDRPERFRSALASGADVVIVDLEDAVAPERKAAARDNVRALLVQATATPVVVRINDARTRWAADDLAMLSRAPAVAGIRIPKVEGAGDVQRVCDALGGRALPLHCVIESARGLEAGFAIATADPSVASVALGEADLRSDLGVSDEDGLLWARSRIVVAARAARLPPPVMSVYPDVNDIDGLAASSRRGRALGFLGRAAIHPRQLPVIEAAFRPSEAEVRDARALLDALASARARHHAVAVLPDGRFVDRAMVEGAQRVIALAEGTRSRR